MGGCREKEDEREGLEYLVVFHIGFVPQWIGRVLQ